MSIRLQLPGILALLGLAALLTPQLAAAEQGQEGQQGQEGDALQEDLGEVPPEAGLEQPTELPAEDPPSADDDAPAPPASAPLFPDLVEEPVEGADETQEGAIDPEASVEEQPGASASEDTASEDTAPEDNAGEEIAEGQAAGETAETPGEGSGKQRVAEPSKPPDPDAPPDGLSNLSAGSLQYVAGVCTMCACCGSPSLAWVAAAAAAVVAVILPGGFAWGPLCVLPIFGSSSLLGCGAILCAPGLGVSSGLWLREWLGIWRGPWAWAVGLAYIAEILAVAGMTIGTFVALFLAISFFGTVFKAPDLSTPAGIFDIFNPIQTWGWAQAGGGAATFFGSFTIGMLWAILIPSLAGVFAYQFLGDQKASYDTGFRVPGILTPNHAEPPKVFEVKGQTLGERRYPRTGAAKERPGVEPAAMRF